MFPLLLFLFIYNILEAILTYNLCKHIVTGRKVIELISTDVTMYLIFHINEKWQGAVIEYICIINSE